MEYRAALRIAKQAQAQLEPVCHRTEVAGSVRRKKEWCKDIEIVCIPIREKTIDLFGEETEQAVKGFVDAVHGLGDILKGSPESGKYVQVDTGEICIDIFIVRPETWGLQLAIRTGCAEFSKKLVTRIKYAGYTIRETQIYSGDILIPCKEEGDVFACVGLPREIEPYTRTEDYNL